VLGCQGMIHNSNFAFVLGWPGIIDEISLTNNNTHVEMTGYKSRCQLQAKSLTDINEHPTTKIKNV